MERECEKSYVLGCGATSDYSFKVMDGSYSIVKALKPTGRKPPQDRQANNISCASKRSSAMRRITA